MTVRVVSIYLNQSDIFIVWPNVLLIAAVGFMKILQY